MSQKRIEDYGAPVVASSLKILSDSLAGQAAVLSGYDFIADAANRLRINPGVAITHEGVIIIEDEAKTLEVANSSLPVDYTVYYLHEDDEISGGVPATLTLDTGLFTETEINGVILGYVRYPGGAVPLSQSHFVQGVPLQIGVIQPNSENSDWLVPIKSHGYMTTSTSGGTIDLTDTWDISGSQPEMYLKLMNNDTSTGTVVLTFPFKVQDISYAIVQMTLATDINAIVTPNFIDSDGTVHSLSVTYSGEPTFNLKTIDIPRDAVQTANTLVYLQIEMSLAVTRQVKLKSLGLNKYNLPI